MNLNLLYGKDQKKELQKILDDIDKTKFALETAYQNFDYVTEPDLIDCYIFEVNSSLKRYKYLLDQATKLDLPPEKLEDRLRQKSSIMTLIS